MKVLGFVHFWKLILLDNFVFNCRVVSFNREATYTDQVKHYMLQNFRVGILSYLRPPLSHRAPQPL